MTAENIKFFVFFCFLAFIFALVVRAFLLKFVTKEPVNPPIDGPSAQHVHEWRALTEFARQCRIRTCGKVEFSYEDNVPDGLRDYIELMATRQARIDPNGEAGHYKELDSRAWGMKCPVCDRVIPSPEDLPQNPFFNGERRELRCPFCKNLLLVRENEGKRRYISIMGDET